ncbi:MAG: hypothetical protein IZT56_08280 [Bacteroidetes bacterium]|nr:hypothetical protein [Bacteroidota bacterium]
MKSIIKLIYLSLFITILISCEKNDDLNISEVSGTYVGTLSTDVAGKSISAKSTSGLEDPATAEITMVGEQIQVHCYNDNFDTTLMLDLFRNNEDLQVCLTGNDFEEMYGHMSADRGGMNGGMMGDTSQWMQHLSDEHEQGDQHFGGFDMSQNAFEYTFNVDGNEYHFQGLKQ